MGRHFTDGPCCRYQFKLNEQKLDWRPMERVASAPDPENRDLLGSLFSLTFDQLASNGPTREFLIVNVHIIVSRKAPDKLDQVGVRRYAAAGRTGGRRL